MKKEHIEVDKDIGFTQAVTVEAGGTKTIYLSGQIGESADLKNQSIEAFANLEKHLAAAGATPSDVVKITIFVVDYSEDKAADAFAGMKLVFKDRDHPPADSMVGVQALYSPQLLIEVEAIAVVSTE